MKIQKKFLDSPESKRDEEKNPTPRRLKEKLRDTEAILKEKELKKYQKKMLRD